MLATRLAALASRAGRGLGAALALSACYADDGPAASGGPIPGATVLMDFTARADFYAAPFPSDARARPDGGVDLDGFPDPFAKDLVARVLAILKRDARGFGRTSAIYLRLSAPIAEEALPDLHGSVADDAKVLLVPIDRGAADLGRRHPIIARFSSDGGPYGAANLLSILPLQGAPLASHRRYAAVVKRSLRDARGDLLGVSSTMAALLAGEAPPGLEGDALASYRAAIEALPAAGIDPADVAGLAVFTTGAPEEQLGRVIEAMRAAPPALDHPFSLTDVFDGFCVYATTLPMPEYQQGKPPYTSEGGDWAVDEDGNPVLQRMEPANFVVTIPRAPMPEAGYPVVVLSRTGAGGERPLVDRGVQAMTGGPAITPGTGPAKEFAAAGFAGASIDGPHGGLRNITHGDEQFLIFNVGNPVALRDNVRQSAAELALGAHVLSAVSVDVSACPGAVAPSGKARFDTGTAALMGHSMGATIAPLTLAFEPRYRAGLLSGCGGSWIENVLHKQKPLAVKGIAEALVGLIGSGYGLHEHEPILNLFQWAGEAADPPVYAARVARAPVDGPPRHVLMMQGIVDHYIMPPIAGAASLSLGLDLAGPERDADVPEIAGFPPLSSLLDLAGGAVIPLPASGNRTVDGAAVTAVVTQHLEDGIEDGHEVVFQTEGPKRQVRCFLAGLSKGLPRVPAAGGAGDPCE